jgi:2-aminoadipate transaminase
MVYMVQPRMLPPISLDVSLEVPLYRQLFEQLKDHIQSGRLSKGERLPATRELAGMLGLNRATVSSAYELLENEGLMKGHVGRGSFVGGPVTSSRIPWSQMGEPAAGSDLPSLSLSAEGISFASSRPAEDLFPLDDFRVTCEEVICGVEAASILQLGSPLGYAPLRDYLMENARHEATAKPGDEIAITSGCQQALDLLHRVLVRPGDTIALEEPVYPGLKSVFASGGSRLIGVPVGPSGVDLATLETLLDRERPRLLIVTPSFQNPTGTTIPLSARRNLLRLARQAGTLLIENDIYGPLRYEGEAVPTLKQLDEDGDVVLLGSFSKIAFPGLRVGWILAPAELIARLREAKQRCDLHSDQLSQAVLLRFAESGRLAAHQSKVLEAGAQRLNAVLAACEKHLPPGSRWTRPQGGMNVWVRLPEPLDSAELLARAERAGVNYLPGKYFAVSRVDSGALRLCFAALSPSQIKEGVAILGEVFGSELARVRAARRAAPMPALV